MDRLPTFFLETFLVHVLLVASSFFSAVHSRRFTIVNNCSSTIWPAVRSNSEEQPNTTGLILKTHESSTLSLPDNWNGRIWGRTHCSRDASTGNFSCLTGDCGSGKLECSSFGAPPDTMAEFGLSSVNSLDFYDVTVVDGFNLPMLVVPKGDKKGNCSSTGCLADMNSQCPWELRVLHPGNESETIACKTACQAFGDPLHCCTGNYSSPDTCRATLYSSYFKNACPEAYSFAFDDEQSLFSCAVADYSADYSIIFCPSSNTSNISAPADAPVAAPFPFPRPPMSTNSFNIRIKFLIGAIGTFLILLTLLGLCWYRRRNCYLQAMLRMNVGSWKNRDNRDKDSLFYSYTAIEIATNYFCDENFLGRGGYGPVYKGKLLNGQEIAVKRLQKISGHGIEQFKNEVSVISNLQHRNLVRLLGYCTDQDERILIYEYLPNKSLDSILFDAEKRVLLGWKSRLQIIEGIAQGLLYLHKYSRLKIVHRDLKTSNVLLDNDLNPKISDFGTAKIFGDDEISANTNRIVGTYGYMAPEYAMDGIFSMKSDVFSFGVMMLEIISGKKNTAFYNADRHINLLGYVWDLWNEERVLEIVDSNLLETISFGEVVRYVQVGLLCVQENAGDRPTMSVVMSMLQNESIPLPTPKQPSFTAILSVTDAGLCEASKPASVNMVSISEITGR